MEIQVLKSRYKGVKEWGLFLESLDNFLDPKSYFMCAMFTLKIQILFALRIKQ